MHEKTVLAIMIVDVMNLYDVLFDRAVFLHFSECDSLHASNVCSFEKCSESIASW